MLVNINEITQVVKKYYNEHYRNNESNASIKENNGEMSEMVRPSDLYKM